MVQEIIKVKMPVAKLFSCGEICREHWEYNIYDMTAGEPICVARFHTTRINGGFVSSKEFIGLFDGISCELGSRRNPEEADCLIFEEARRFLDVYGKTFARIAVTPRWN